MQTSRKVSTPFPLFVAVAIVFYALFVSAALIFLSPLISVIFCILPFGLFIFNRTWAFHPPLKSLHILFVCAIVIFILWPRYLAFNFGGPDITPSRILYALLLCLWSLSFASPIYRREFLATLRGIKIWLVMLIVYILLRIISCFFSSAPIFSFYLIANELLTAVLIFPIVISIYKKRDRIRSLFIWLFLAGIVVALMTIVEATISRTLFANISLPGMRVDNQWLESMLMDKVRGGKYRAQSTFSHPLLLAEFMVFALPFAIYFMAHNRFILRLVGLFGFVLFVVAAIATGSRSALVAIPIVVLLSIATLSTRQKRTFEGGAFWIITILAICFGLITCIVLLTTGTVDLRIITGKGAEEAASSTMRVLMLSRGLPLIGEHPLVGYGPGLAGYTLGFGKSSGAITIDNFYLSISLETGLPALFIFVLLAFGLAFKGYYYSFQNATLEGLMAGMLGISVLGMLIVKSILSIPHNAPLLFMALALIVVIPQLSENEEKDGG